MLLADDGHEVTVLERDPAGPPDPAESWDSWPRRGVTQFRLPHFLLPAFRATAEKELPRVVESFEAAGAYRFNALSKFTRGAMTEPRFEVLTARRPILESVVARAAQETPGLTIRRGCAVDSLISAPEREGVPHVKGVTTQGGEKIGADLVVDCGGRRSALGRWLDGIGAAPLVEEKEDSGVVYYGYHVRTADGSPFPLGPGVTSAGSVGLLALPADDGTAGIGIIPWGGDAPMRALRHEGPWRAVAKLIPGGETVLDAEQISPLVSMASLDDRWHRLSVDGVPLATGIVAVGDALASTNPTAGRGISLGLRHSVALRDAMREHGDHPRQLAERFDAVTEEQFTPWYRASIWSDRHRIAAVQAEVQGTSYEPDPEWRQWTRVNQLPFADVAFLPDILDCGMNLKRLPSDLLADDRIQEGLATHPAPPPQPDDASGPTRAQLLEAISTA